MSLLTPEPGLLFWMTLSFGAVLFVLVKYGFPTILKSVDKRKNYIDESLQAARDAREELANVKKAGEEMMAATREEQAAMLRETAALREKLMVQARDDATKESEKIIVNAREQVRAEKEEALREIRNEIAVLSVNLTEKILREKLSTGEEQMSLIERLLDETDISRS
ncbi:MAG: F0F1 ATP synthase subunit B [Bacteroidales bacterium]|nr:F0F1 ATP synthase subunit B [Bacteroidales bacterium]